MKMSRAAKVAIAAATVVVAVAYAAVVELGVNAGRVHFGVNVRGMDVGGLTVEEAAQRLEGRAALLDSEPVVLGAKGLEDLRVRPSDIGWHGDPKTTPRLAATTAREAMAVGRRGGLWQATLERLRAYFEGVEVEWAGGPKPGKLSRLVNQVAKDAAAAGLRLDEARLRGKIKRLVQSWPRKKWYRIPVIR